MTHLRSAVVPVYVLLCLILGGSAQGVWSNAALQLLAAAIIGWSVATTPAVRLTRAARQLAALAGLTLLLFAIQLIPLPPALWTAFPGREFVAEGFRLLGQPQPWLPISLVPYETLATALTLLPPIAVAMAMLLQNAYRSDWLVGAVLAGAFFGVLLGALQVSSADPFTSPWYLYKSTNFGMATGFFANSNHMGALLVISVPLLLALIRDLRDRAKSGKSEAAIVVIACSGTLVVLLGIALNGSLAVLLLGPAVLAITASTLLPSKTSLGWRLGALLVLGVIPAALLYFTPLYDRLMAGNSLSMAERWTMWNGTARAIGEYFPVGTGIASFPQIYPRFEDPLQISTTFTNHAHSDYLEIALDTGILGILLLAGFLLWWALQTQGIWRSRLADPYARAATIASAALLIHSLVDYPLRTAAMSAVMASLLVLMARPSARTKNSEADLWPTRHLAA